MVVLDATIVNVALPSIQHGLHFSPSSLQWVVNAYTLIFGGFLLLGGRASDLLGRQRLFMAGRDRLHRRLARQRRRDLVGHADRRPRAAGPRRRARLAGGALDRHDDVRRRRGAHEGARRSGARSPPAAAPSAWCSAACSPRRSRGAGSSSSTCRSGSRPRCCRCATSPNTRAEERPETSTSPARRPSPAVCSCSSTTSSRRSSTAGRSAQDARPRSRSRWRCSRRSSSIELRSKAPLIRLGIFRMRSLSGAQRGDVVRHLRALRDVLLRLDLRAGDPRLQPAEGRPRVRAGHASGS